MPLAASAYDGYLAAAAVVALLVVIWLMNRRGR